MNYIIINGELYHHGVKGMKWGVRRAQKKAEKKAAKAQKKWEENVSKNWIHAYNRAASKDNARLKAFNDKYKADKISDPKAHRKYIEDYCKSWNDIYTNELVKTFGKAPIDNGRQWCQMVAGFADPSDFD